LREEYNKQSTDFIKIRDAMTRVEASAHNPDAAGDLALIFNYMKILDPGSTVREGEFANAQNSGSAYQKMWGIYNRVVSGKRLEKTQRDMFVKRARKLYKGQELLQRRLEKEYTGLAKHFNVNVPGVVPQKIFPMKDLVEELETHYGGRGKFGYTPDHWKKSIGMGMEMPYSISEQGVTSGKIPEQLFQPEPGEKVYEGVETELAGQKFNLIRVP
jgi:hypothetical protein